MTIKRKPEKDLATRIVNCHDEANALIDAEAERIKRTEAQNAVPAPVIRQMIMARHQCVCGAALDIINEGLAQWPEDKDR
jgi:hypothetical protein